MITTSTKVKESRMNQPPIKSPLTAWLLLAVGVLALFSIAALFQPS